MLAGSATSTCSTKSADRHGFRSVSGLPKERVDYPREDSELLCQVLCHVAGHGDQANPTAVRGAFSYSMAINQQNRASTRWKCCTTLGGIDQPNPSLAPRCNGCEADQTGGYMATRVRPEHSYSQRNDFFLLSLEP